MITFGAGGGGIQAEPLRQSGRGTMGRRHDAFALAVVAVAAAGSTFSWQTTAPARGRQREGVCVGAQPGVRHALREHDPGRFGAGRCGAGRCGGERCGSGRCRGGRCGAGRCGAGRCGAGRCGAGRCARAQGGRGYGGGGHSSRGRLAPGGCGQERQSQRQEGDCDEWAPVASRERQEADDSKNRRPLPWFVRGPRRSLLRGLALGGLARAHVASTLGLGEVLTKLLVQALGVLEDEPVARLVVA